MHLPTTLQHALPVLGLCLALALPTAGCTRAEPGTQATVAAASGDPAVALVQRMHTGEGLESLANDVATRTTTFAALVHQHGRAEAEHLVRSEISKALPAYQGRWDQNLASIYARHFTVDELDSLVSQGASSPYAGKLLSSQAAVAAEMRTASTPLLEQLVTDALSNAVKQ